MAHNYCIANVLDNSFTPIFLKFEKENSIIFELSLLGENRPA